MTRIAAIALLALIITLLSASASQAQSGFGQAGTVPPSAPQSGPALAPTIATESGPSSDCAYFCTLRPYFRASLGGGAGIFLTSEGHGTSSTLWPVDIEGLGRLDLVFGHDIAADPGLRIQIQYRAVGFGNRLYLAHRHLLELTVGLGSVFSFRAGGGASVRHVFQSGLGTSGVITVGIDLTVDAFLMSFDLATFDFLPGVLEWTPSLSFGFQIR